MSNELYDFNIGHSTAYAYAKASGDLPEGMTPDEYGELLAAYATVGQTAVDAKDAAVAANTAAETAANTATTKASEATTAAQTATTKAGEASQSASQAQTSAQTASTKASEASQSATTATEKATEATTAADTATTAKNDAVSAKNAAETAQGKAEDAQAAAEAVAESIPSDYSQLSEDVSELKSELSDTRDWLGYPSNLFDARMFEISNSTNWTLNSKTKTSFSVTHNNSYTTGFLKAPLSFSVGRYVFHADFTNSLLKFMSLRKDDATSTPLYDGTEFEIEEGSTYFVYFAPESAGTYVVTDISINADTTSGKVPNIENEITELQSEVVELQSDVSDLKSGFADIAELDINSLVGTETQSVAIMANGTVYAAGSSNYRLAKYDVVAGKKYWITANSNWGNLLWCFYDASDAVVALGQASARESADTIITNTEVTAPVGASYILVAYNSTVAPVDCKTQTGYVLKGKWEGKKWVCVGDSLTAENNRTTKHYFDYVADETGITTVNMGDSGSGYAREQDVGTAFYQRIGDCPTDADVVTIFGSFNDLGAGLPIGAVDDTGTTTLAGCINTTIDNLQAVIPLVNLGIIAPTPWDTTQPSTSGQAFNYVEMLKSICERRSIPFLDLWRCSNLRPWDADFRELAYSKDGGSGTHPDENGHKLIAPRFKAFLETLLM